MKTIDFVLINDAAAWKCVSGIGLHHTLLSHPLFLGLAMGHLPALVEGET